MKNFKENALVQEINVEEMMNINGGGLAEWILGLLISEMLDEDAPNDFKEGRQAARDFWGV